MRDFRDWVRMVFLNKCHVTLEDHRWSKVELGKHACQSIGYCGHVRHQCLDCRRTEVSGEFIPEVR